MVLFNFFVIVASYVLVNTWNYNFADLISSTNKIHPQTYSASIACVINIPVSLYMAKNATHDSSGVIYGTIIPLSLFAIINTIQSYLLIRDENAK
ncbi:MAG: hypothetical protein D6B27_07045 [Gammaproteobacteria bacterium]|mgnify:CR=1 FL=1|nr:MAG: hypothetical protein D6B27_07045 [Gammaproteobacteria bacterium]